MLTPRRKNGRRFGLSPFRIGLLAVLLLAAGSLYTPYPAALVRALLGRAESDAQPSAGAADSPAPNEAAPVPVIMPDESPDRRTPPPTIWKHEARFTMPAINLPPFPPALPERVEPGNYEHIASMSKGINIVGNVHFRRGSTASRDRLKRQAYAVKVSLELLLPHAAEGRELLHANPKLPDVLPGFDALMQKARVSRWFNALYLHKQNRIRKNASTLTRLLDRHNYLDTDTILEIEAPTSRRKLLWIQADMDVVSDGSDGDRLPTMPDKILKSDNYQPSTSYFWRKRSKTPNPLLAPWQERLRKQKAQKASASVIAHTETVIDNLKTFSYLLAEYDPFIVIPLTLCEGSDNGYRPSPGDYAVVIVGKRVFPAIVGDYGPNFKTGEASLRLAREVNPRAGVYARAVSDLGVSYLIFPGSAEEEKGPIDYDRLNARCLELLEDIGGLAPGASFVRLRDKLAPKKDPSSDKGDAAKDGDAKADDVKDGEKDSAKDGDKKTSGAESSEASRAARAASATGANSRDALRGDEPPRLPAIPA